MMSPAAPLLLSLRDTAEVTGADAAARGHNGDGTAFPALAVRKLASFRWGIQNTMRS